ncbi:hypothetical protein AAG906_011328 [Vitis piasezkii]
MAPRMMDNRSLSNHSLNPMIQVPNLPENAEATTDIASDLFQEPMARFMDASAPDWNSPNGSERRTKDRGVVCTTWALQLKMLTQASIGGFLSHSKWSFVVKDLYLARPLILLTFLAGQGLNANFLQEKETEYLTPRNGRDGSFTRNSMAHSLSLVVLEEEGKIYRDKAKEMKRVFGDMNRQNEYVDSFLNCLQHLRVIS